MSPPPLSHTRGCASSLHRKCTEGVQRGCRGGAEGVEPPSAPPHWHVSTTPSAYSGCASSLHRKCTEGVQRGCRGGRAPLYTPSLACLHHPFCIQRLRVLPPQKVHRVAGEDERPVPTKQLPVVFKHPHFDLVVPRRRHVLRAEPHHAARNGQNGLCRRSEWGGTYGPRSCQRVMQVAGPYRHPTPVAHTGRGDDKGR
eukprot:1194018-Prorocentrum_minimum.AAC.2